MITHQQAKDFFEYRNGQLFWKVKKAVRIKIGDLVGTTGQDGYFTVIVNNKKYFVHRLIWFWHTGSWPKDYIDHINGIRSDNRIENLRECSKAENAQNRKTQKNASGYRGVYKDGAKFRAQIRHNGKGINLGTFTDPADAHQAYLIAKSKLHTFNPVPR